MANGDTEDCRLDNYTNDKMTSERLRGPPISPMSQKLATPLTMSVYPSTKRIMPKQQIMSNGTSHTRNSTRVDVVTVLQVESYINLVEILL